MAEEQTNTLNSGTWANLQDDDTRREKIDFEINKSVRVTFPQDFVEPREMQSTMNNGVFYVFDVIADETEKCIMTSAWTLLRGLKKNEPLAGKSFFIMKTMDKGKQSFNVELIK